MGTTARGWSHTGTAVGDSECNAAVLPPFDQLGLGFGPLVPCLLVVPFGPSAPGG
jgi:hypothetical protein